MTPKCSYSGVTEEKLRAMQLVCSGDDLEGDARRIRFLFLASDHPGKERLSDRFRAAFTVFFIHS